MCVRMLPRAGQTAVFVRDKTQKIYLIATIKPRGPGVTWYMYIMPQIICKMLFFRTICEIIYLVLSEEFFCILFKVNKKNENV